MNTYMEDNKALVRMAVGKGRLLRATNEYLASLGIEPIDEHSRLLVHKRELGNCILEISLFRWQDIKSYTNDFDLLIYGEDQWLESEKKSMITLKHLNLSGNCRLSLLVPEGKSRESLDYFLNHRIKVATGYPNLAEAYLGVSNEDIVYMSGSVESAIQLGWASSIFDVVESGDTARANGLLEYKIYLEFGATLATTKGELIPFFRDLKLIDSNESGKRLMIAFDGLPGSRKEVLAKYTVQAGISKSCSIYPLVLVQPYSGYIGFIAKALSDSGDYVNWVQMVGQNHWRAPDGVNSVYDGSILTCLVELLKCGVETKVILDALKTWEPLPNILFYCDITPQCAYSRISGSKAYKDVLYSIERLEEYKKLYDLAYQFIMDYKCKLGVMPIKLDANKGIDSLISDIKALDF